MLKQSPRLGEELIALAYDDHPEPKVLAGLAEGMEILASVVPDAKFREASAHLLARHAIVLHNRGVGNKTVEKILTRALAIYPDSPLAKSTRRDMEEDKIWIQFDKALKQQNLSKAVEIIQSTGSSKMYEQFFQLLESWQAQIQGWDDEPRWAALHDLHHHALQLDPGHPVTQKLDKLLQRERP